MLGRLTLMHVRSWLVIVTVLGCADHASRSAPPTADPTLEQRSPPGGAPQHDPSAASPIQSIPVVVTGVLERRGQEIEICPGQNVGPCPGIRVVGKVQDAWLSARGKVTVWRLAGAYDGTTLVVDRPAEPSALGNPPDYRNSCPEFQKPIAGGNADERLIAAVATFVQEHDERVAGQWWDRERQTMVVWVKGDATELRRSFAQRAPGARVCIQGQARFSQAELESARSRADRVLTEHGIDLSGSWLDVVENRVVYQADAIDAPTLAQLAREAGDSIQVVAFLELPEHALARMPVPAPRGDVPLVTSKTRSGAGMAALGRFTVHYDAELRCVYLDAQGERLLPVWPFGYWATATPLRVFDYDDNVVAEAGATIEMGGGQVDARHIRTTTNTCGAKLAWVGQPQAPSAAAAPARAPR